MPTQSKIGQRWAPKNWRPEYDKAVFLSVLGKSNTEIASQLGFTKEHVSSILNLPQGKEFAEQLHARMRARMEVDIPAEMATIAGLAVRRLKSVMTDDELFEKSPFAVVDRGLDVLKGLKHLVGGGNGSPSSIQPGQNNTTVVVVSNGQKSELMEGLDRVREVRQLHSGNGNGNKST